MRVTGGEEKEDDEEKEGGDGRGKRKGEMTRRRRRSLINYDEAQGKVRRRERLASRQTLETMRFKERK
jgi:hypothetical protein